MDYLRFNSSFLKRSSYNTDLIDSPESDYLYISKSKLPNAGKGLFTVVDLYKDEIISLFKGVILTDRQVDIRVKKGVDQYFIDMLDGTIMDSMTVKCFAKYANDSQGYSHSVFKNNSKIAIDEDGNVCLISTKKIKKGEEIFCSYGKRYWNKHRIEKTPAASRK